MNRGIGVMVAALCLPACVWAGSDASRSLTPAQTEHGITYLQSSRDGVVNAVKDLSPAQWAFKPSPDRWSIAEIVEHLAVTEERLGALLGKLDQAKPAPDRDPAPMDAMIETKVPDRTVKVKAPPEMTPSGRWTPAEALQHFEECRQHTIETLRTSTTLRDHVIDHPVFGPLDGYQWILAAGGHSVRHTAQIAEVKSDPRFPAR